MHRLGTPFRRKTLVTNITKDRRRTCGHQQLSSFYEYITNKDKEQLTSQLWQQTEQNHMFRLTQPGLGSRGLGEAANPANDRFQIPPPPNKILN